MSVCGLAVTGNNLPVRRTTMPDIARVSSLPRVTPSSIGDLECHRRHWILRQKREWPKRPMIRAVAFGICVHETLRLCYQNRVGDKPCLDHVGAWARTAVWKGRWPESVNRSEETDKVITAVCAFVENDASDPEAVMGIMALEAQLEHPLTHEGEEIGLYSAKLDQILCRASEPNRLVVREIKTTSPRIDLRECYLQLSLAKRKYPDFGKYAIEFLWLNDDGRVTMDVVEDNDLKGIHAVVRQAAVAAITDTEHTPTSGEGCIYCPIRDTCPTQKVEG
jgi:hypothetical protein